MASNRPKYLLTVKTANGSAPDLPIDCSTVFCVLDIKSRLLDVHPSHPPIKEQKLIYKGALLPDEKLLKDVFEMDKEVCIHLVISPVVLRSNSVPASHLKNQTADIRPHPLPTSTTPSADSQSNQTPESEATPNNYGPGLRHRYPMAQMITIPTQQPVATPPFPVNNQMMWSNPYMFSPYHAAQLAQWYHHAATAHQQGPTHPWTNHDNTNRLMENQPEQGEVPVGGVVDPQNQDELEIPDEMGAGGAAGGLALMADNNRRRDAVDYAYMLMMMVFLGCIGYVTGSFYQFMIFFGGVAIILMNQGGWFRLQRRQVRDDQPPPNQQPAPPPRPDEANPEQEQPTNEERNTRDETDNGGHNREEPLIDEGDEPAAATPTPAQPRPGPIAMIMVFITSFFSSLLPQQIPELQAN